MNFEMGDSYCHDLSDLWKLFDGLEIIKHDDKVWKYELGR